MRDLYIDRKFCILNAAMVKLIYIHDKVESDYTQTQKQMHEKLVGPNKVID